MLTFGIDFFSPLLWLPLRARGPQGNHEDYAQFHFRQSSSFFGGEKVDGFLVGVQEGCVAGVGGSGEGGGGPWVFRLNFDS